MTSKENRIKMKKSLQYAKGNKEFFDELHEKLEGFAKRLDSLKDQSLAAEFRELAEDVPYCIRKRCEPRLICQNYLYYADGSGYSSD